VRRLSASATSTVFTDETTLLIDQALCTAVRTLLPFGFRAVGYVFLQGTLYANLPGIDAL
jgi:hypothetical protein